MPADLQARVLSVSAVGEQYVDLVPKTDSGPYLENGSVIAAKNTTVPQAVGPMLDRVHALLKSIPKGGYRTCSTRPSRPSTERRTTSARCRSRRRGCPPISGCGRPVPHADRDSRPLLDGQLASTDAIRTWARSLAGITGQLNADDPQWRAILANRPGAADEATALLNQVKPTLPVLLANLTTVGQVAVTYHASIEQLLVLLPPYVASLQSIGR